jgi:succinyl-CoA synthetase beta subunit
LQRILITMPVSFVNLKGVVGNNPNSEGAAWATMSI